MLNRRTFLPAFAAQFLALGHWKRLVDRDLLKARAIQLFEYYGADVQRNAVLVKGGRMRSTATLSYADGTLEKGWPRPGF